MNYLKLVLNILLASTTMQPFQSQCMSRLFNPRNFALIGVTATVGAVAYKAANYLYFNSIHWDWKNIDPTSIKVNQFTTKGLDFSPWMHKEPGKIITVSDFFKLRTSYLHKLPQDTNPSQNEWLWGAATSAYQVEGDCTNNQWYLFEGKELDGKTIEPAASGCDSWNHEDEDIANMKELGLNTYRFSVEWSKVCPKLGVIDISVLNHYKQFCKKLVQNGIKPVITLYHYTEPIWFYKLGSFEKTENIHHFVFFCQKVFEELHEYVYAWFTFNSPEGIALAGWSQGLKPPAKKDMLLAVQVLYNILDAHVQVYQRIKSLAYGNQSRIGILKNILQLDPWDIANPLHHLACYVGNHLQNDSIYNFFTTGEFNAWVPTKASYKATNQYIKNGGKCLDFIGLNYYCHNYMKDFKKPFRHPDPTIEFPMRNPRYTIYGEGLYRAIAELSQRVAKPLNIPIYITENGIGIDKDAAGDQKRIEHNQRYLYALARAIQDGHDVRGYIHWSLMDNFEWGQYDRFYGLFEVDRSTNALERTKKPGACYFESVVKGSQAIAHL